LTAKVAYCPELTFWSGEQNQALISADGNFTTRANKGAGLLITYIGYNTKEDIINNNVVKIILQ